MKIIYKRSPAGFSLLELVLVAAVCAMIFSALALAYRSASINLRRTSTYQTVTLSNPVSSSFFPGSAPASVDSYVAPNFGRSTVADQARNMFMEDSEKSIAVFALPRKGSLNAIRQRTLSLGTYMAQSLDTPAKFLECLSSVPATAANAAVFTTYRGAPPESTGSGPSFGYLTNGTIFCLQPSGSATQMWVRAVWEIDYVPFTDATGTPCLYATVRRYVNTTLTFYYDIVFRNSTLAQVGVPFVHFERSARNTVTEGNANFKLARNQPFYMIWWPDPSMSGISTTATAATYTGARASYWRKEGQTSSVIIVPQYPAL